MKSLILTLAVVVTGSFGKAETVCQAFVPISEQSTFGEHYEVKFPGPNLYEISHYGSSRNTYSAVYKVNGGTPTRIGEVIYLKKIQDNSTWKDMPQKLTIEYKDFFAFYGFSVSGFGSHAPSGEVWFSEKSCFDLSGKK